MRENEVRDALEKMRDLETKLVDTKTFIVKSIMEDSSMMRFAKVDWTGLEVYLGLREPVRRERNGR